MPSILQMLTSLAEVLLQVVRKPLLLDEFGPESPCQSAAGEKVVVRRGPFQPSAKHLREVRHGAPNCDRGNFSISSSSLLGKPNIRPTSLVLGAAGPAASSRRTGKSFSRSLFSGKNKIKHLKEGKESIQSMVRGTSSVTEETTNLAVGRTHAQSSSGCKYHAPEEVSQNYTLMYCRSLHSLAARRGVTKTRDGTGRTETGRAVPSRYGH